MVERLGNVLYWTGCIAAMGVAGFFVSVIPYAGFNWEIAGFSVSLAAGCWAFGRALRYILSGR